MDKNQTYKKSIQEILNKRINNLYSELGMSPPQGPDQTHYYTLMDVNKIAVTLHGKDFADYLAKNFTIFDILLRLAEEKYTVLLPGRGFAGPEWSFRVSLANLKDEEYKSIGRNIRQVIDNYYSEWISDKED